MMYWRNAPALCGWMVLSVFLVTVCHGGMNTWNGPANGDWFTAGNWSTNGVPGNGDDVAVTNGTILLTNSTAQLNAFSITNATLTFSNWTTRLYATNVTLRTNGFLSLSPAFLEAQMSNRIYITCGTLTIDNGGKINAQGKGYVGSGYQGQGPGKAVGGAYNISSPGAGYGGKGGQSLQSGSVGSTYGVTNAPTAPGSSAGDYLLPGDGGCGGGAVRIEAAGAVTNNGTILANGVTPVSSGPGGGGSGGSIFITCASFQGAASGVLNADGGNSGTGGGGGGGGGGRIAVGIGLTAQNIADLLAGSNTLAGMYVYTNQAAYLGRMSVTNGVCGGAPTATLQWGQPGTRQFMTISAAGTCLLDIKGDPDTFGAPTPSGYGVNPGLPQNIWITNSVSSPVSATTGLQRACIGWRLTDTLGRGIGNDTSTQAVFQLTNDFVLTWQWTNMWQLAVTNGPNGTVNFADKNGWYTNGFQVTGIQATPADGYMFLRWFGDVPVSDRTNNPLTVTMTQARSLTAMFASSSGETKTWTGTGNWINPLGTNWAPAGVPGPLDDVVMQSGTSTVDEAQSMKSLVVTNGATLVFTNWSTILTVSGDVTIRTNGVITLAPPFTESQMSNRVYLVCSNLTLDAGGTINAQGKGWQGSGFYGQGTGKSQGGGANYVSAGAGHGGKGGNTSDGYQGGVAYGLTNAPVEPGSGAGAAYVPGGDGHGGGAVRVAASGTVAINGTINANGVDGSAASKYGGGGAGGSIFITCASFQGAASGVLSVNGGNGGTDARTGGGGGGRISVGIGLSAQNIADLLAGSNTVQGMNVYQTDADYSGRLSLSNGVCAAAPANTAQWGQLGTVRFIVVASGATFILNISGDPANYGAAAPLAYGVYLGLPQNIWITNSVSSPVSATTGLQRACTGWRLTDTLSSGSISNGTSTQAIFQLTTNLTLTWQWTNVWQLTVTNAATQEGTVNSAAINGWYTNGFQVTGIQATASNNYTFVRWFGDVPLADQTNNPLTVTMTQARSLAPMFASLSGEAKAWTGTGDWINPLGTNWMPAGVPGPLDDVWMQSGTSTMNQVQTMKSLMVSNGAALVCTNWSTILTVSGDVTIRTNGSITLAPPFLDGQMSNRIYITCANLTIDAGGKIDALGKGYQGSGYNGQGPGKASGGAGDSVNAAAGHGGKGGNSGQYPASHLGGPPYDVTNAPAAPGSGGSDAYTASLAHGGGAVRIEASGVVTVNGTITANGLVPTVTSLFGAGGSGGSIFITCAELKGAASGKLSADGANSANEYRSAGGGGGRIAVWHHLSATNRLILLANPDNPVLPPRVTVTNICNALKFYGTASVTNGICPATNLVAQYGGIGTIRFLSGPIIPPGTLITLK